MSAVIASWKRPSDEAITVLRKTALPIDVVLSQNDIPGSMNGLGFAQWARSVRPELKILMARTPEQTGQNAAELCGAGPTLKRPYEHKLVLDRIKRLLVARAQQLGGRGDTAVVVGGDALDIVSDKCRHNKPRYD